MQRDLKLIGTLLSRSVGHDMLGGHQIQKIVLPIKESRGVGEPLSARESQDFRHTQVHIVNAFHTNKHLDSHGIIPKSVVPNDIVEDIGRNGKRQNSGQFSYVPAHQ